MLRPDTSVTNGDLPGTLDALSPDGTLVQTVLGVVRDRSMLRQAASDVNVQLTPAYTLEATVQPGSTLIESTVSGPDRSAVDRLAAAYSRSASNYVAASYSAYVLERLSSDSVTGGSGPGGLQVAILALLVGAALGVALVAAELRLEPQFKRFLRGVETDRRAKRAAKPRPEPTGPVQRQARARARTRARRARRTAGQPARCPSAPARAPQPSASSSGHRGRPTAATPLRARRRCATRTRAEVHHAGLTRPAPPRAAQAGAALWAGRLAIALAAFAVGTALGRAENPIALLLLAAVGVFAAAATIAQLRWSLVGGLFLMVAYAPDVLASRSATHALIALLVAAALLRVATGRERVFVTRELVAFGALAGRLRARVDRGERPRGGRCRDARPGQLRRRRRAAAARCWTPPSGCGARSGRSSRAWACWRSWRSSSRSRRPTARPTAASPACCRTGDALRSAGPLNPNPFGQVLATSAVLAFYLARTARGARSRAAARSR